MSGRNSIRRLLKSETVWKDREQLKHKHDFSIHQVAEVTYGNPELGRQFIGYYDVMKCRYCNSFKAISRDGAIDGYMPGYVYNGSLPLIRLYKSNKTLGYGGATYIETINNH